eukprot:4568304-Alexandrium_andersonii.AAC.1
MLCTVRNANAVDGQQHQCAIALGYAAHAFRGRQSDRPERFAAGGRWGVSGSATWTTALGQQRIKPL